MKKLLTTFILLFCTASVIHAKDFVRKRIRNAVRRKAVCNDGSPGIYYFRAGTGTGKKRWVITLPCGTGYCTSPFCDGSSIGYPSRAPGADIGINSDSACENPDFYNSNQAIFINCTEDMYSGNNTFLGGAGPIEFRGSNYVRYTIQDLIDKSTLGKRGAEVLLLGISCGGVGVMSHLDWLAQKLPHAKVRGLNDSGWIFPSKFNDYAEQRHDLKLWAQAWKPEVNETCAIAHPLDKSECFLPSVYPYLKTPLFVQYTQWDYHFVPSDPSNHHTKTFSREVRHSLAPVAAAFSSQYHTSAVVYREDFISVKVNGFSLSDLLGNWFFDRAGPVKEISKSPNAAVAPVCGGN